MGTGETRYLTLGGGAPWGFRLQGGGAHPLTVSKVRRKGKANMNDLREGDIVRSINGVPVEGKTHEVAMEYVDQAASELVLEIMRPSGRQPQRQEAPTDQAALRHVVQETQHEQYERMHDPQAGLKRFSQAPKPQSPQPKFQPVALAQAQMKPSHQPPQVNTKSASYSFGDANSTTHVQASGYEQVSNDGRNFVRQQQMTSVTQGHPGQKQPSQPPMFKPTKFQPGQPHVNVTAMFGDRDKENISPFQQQQQQPQQKEVPSFAVKNNRQQALHAETMVLKQQQQEAYAKHHKPYQPPSLDQIQSGQFHPSYDPSFGPQWKERGDDYDVEVTTDTDVRHDDRPHVFGPQVQISLAPPNSLPVPTIHVDDGLTSPDSDLLGRKKVFSDSAFYNDPEANFPTIEDQMKLCKTIALSLTSEANRKARGARMFAKRRKFSPKWTTIGGSSSGGDVGMLTDLHSELYEEDGGIRPLFSFRIPAVATQYGIPDPPKMTLTKEEFEKVRLKADKNEHRSVSPNTCFSLVADLHSQKGRGARMFERRLKKSENWVVDESNVPLTPGPAPSQNQLEHILKVPLKSAKTPWDAALDGGVKQQIPLQPLTPSQKSSLTAENQPGLMDGPKFNITAKGWKASGDEPTPEAYEEEVPAQPQQEPPPVAPKPQQQFRDFNPQMRGFQGASPTQMDHGDPAMWSSQTSAYSQDSELDNYMRNGGYPGAAHNFSPHGGFNNHGYPQQPIALPGSDL